MMIRTLFASGRAMLTMGLVASLAAVASSYGADSAPAVDLSGKTDASIRAVLDLVSRHQVHPLKDGDYTPVDSIEAASKATPPEGLTWNYPWGVTLYGTLRSTDATGDMDVRDFVIKHNRIDARYYAWAEALRKKVGDSSAFTAFARKTKISGLLRLGSLDSCGAMGTETLEEMLRYPDQVIPEQKAVVERIADWIVNKQDRLPDGTLWRSKSMGGTMWPDDLYMACPFLVRWAKYTGDSKYLDDAANQIIHMAAVMADTDGLWFHGYFVNEKKHAPFKWGRGNGWVTVATVEVLSALPENHPARAKLIEILRNQVNGLKPLQTPSGMWRQILDKPDFWEETSCTAMFAYGIARAVNRGWIDPSNMAMARKAFVGLCQHIGPDGSVNGTCQGTNINTDADYYMNRQQPPDDLHGRGVVLLAGTEILAADKGK